MIQSWELRSLPARLTNQQSMTQLGWKENVFDPACGVCRVWRHSKLIQEVYVYYIYILYFYTCTFFYKCSLSLSLSLCNGSWRTDKDYVSRAHTRCVTEVSKIFLNIHGLCLQYLTPYCVSRTDQQHSRFAKPPVLSIPHPAPRHPGNTKSTTNSSPKHAPAQFLAAKRCVLNNPTKPWYQVEADADRRKNGMKSSIYFIPSFKHCRI